MAGGSTSSTTARATNCASSSGAPGTSSAVSSTELMTAMKPLRTWSGGMTCGVQCMQCEGGCGSASVRGGVGEDEERGRGTSRWRDTSVEGNLRGGTLLWTWKGGTRGCLR
eukprot:360484-Chlamydomonas_euryale.AAC.3